MYVSFNSVLVRAHGCAHVEQQGILSVNRYKSCEGMQEARTIRFPFDERAKEASDKHRERAHLKVPGCLFV